MSGQDQIPQSFPPGTPILGGARAVVPVPTPVARRKPPRLALESLAVTATCTGGIPGEPVTAPAGLFTRLFDFATITTIRPDQLDFLATLPVESLERILDPQEVASDLEMLLHLKKSQVAAARGRVEELRSEVATLASAWATANLLCEFSNAERTAACAGNPDPDAPGAVTTSTVAAGTLRGTVSQADVDEQALAVAQARLVCRYRSDAVTVTCADLGAVNRVDGAPSLDQPPGFAEGVAVVGDESLRWSVTIPAGEILADSQELANEQAYALALARLTCGRVPNRAQPVVGCTDLQPPKHGTAVIGVGSILGRTRGSSVTIPAGVFVAGTTDEADEMSRVLALALLDCRWKASAQIDTTCPPQTILIEDLEVISNGTTALAEATLLAAFTAARDEIVAKSDDVSRVAFCVLHEEWDSTGVEPSFTVWAATLTSPPSDLATLVSATRAAVVELAAAGTRYLRERFLIATKPDTQTSRVPGTALGLVEVWSSVSQADADAQLAAAIDASSGCQYCNKEIPAFHVGTLLETRTVAAGMFCAPSYAASYALARDYATGLASATARPGDSVPFANRELVVRCHQGYDAESDGRQYRHIRAESLAGYDAAIARPELTIRVGQFTSLVSLADAEAKAKAWAEAQLTCQYWEVLQPPTQQEQGPDWISTNRRSNPTIDANFDSGTIVFVPVVGMGRTITGIGIQYAGGGGTPTLARAAIFLVPTWPAPVIDVPENDYTVDYTGGTRVARTADFFEDADGTQQLLEVPLESPYLLATGKRYLVAVIHVGASPWMRCTEVTSRLERTMRPALAARLVAQTDIPETIEVLDLTEEGVRIPRLLLITS